MESQKLLVSISFQSCWVVHALIHYDLCWISELSPAEDALDWYTRMKIALGAAQGLEYLHDKADPPIIYRDLKSSNILLDKHLNAKLADWFRAGKA